MIELGEDILKQLSKRELEVFAERELNNVALTYLDTKVDKSIPKLVRARNVIEFGNQTIWNCPALGRLADKRPIKILSRPTYEIFIGIYTVSSCCGFRYRGGTGDIYRFDLLDAQVYDTYDIPMQLSQKGIAGKLANISRLEMLKRIESSIKGK